MLGELAHHGGHLVEAGARRSSGTRDATSFAITAARVTREAERSPTEPVYPQRQGASGASLELFQRHVCGVEAGEFQFSQRLDSPFGCQDGCREVAQTEEVEVLGN